MMRPIVDQLKADRLKDDTERCLHSGSAHPVAT
jgi:hypothetical protein